MSDILETIARHKHTEIATAKKKTSFSEMEERAKAMPPVRGFADALFKKYRARETGLIAEIKKASPSKGVIRADFDVASLARAYEGGGAACLSVLTDETFFQGHNDNIRIAREACALPVLRKDFLFDTYQVVQSRAIGADCILIIMSAVDDRCAKDLLEAATHYGMDALVEVHDENELLRALKLNARMIGINNRNLRTFEVDLATSERLSKQLPKDRLIVAESGITNRQDIQRLNASRITTFLIGETFMRETDVQSAVENILKK